MKNVENCRVKKCICMNPDDFEELIAKVISKDIEVQYCEIHVSFYDESIDEELDEFEVYDKLAKYFDVKKITFIELQECEIPDIWIEYKD